MIDFVDELERSIIARRVLPFPAQTRAEHRFKAAFMGLVLGGLYPSGRQIYKRIGKNVNGKVNLNGRECNWLNEMRELFGIEPYVGYMRRRDREDWEGWLHNSYDGPKYPFKLRRGPKGTLVVCEEWINNRRADQKAATAQHRGVFA